MNKVYLRDWVLVGVMAIVGLLLPLHQPQKLAATQKINIAASIPEQFGKWTSKTYETNNYSDEWQSINELLARRYVNFSDRESVDLVVEYTSDMRRSFSFHYPENCYRAGGNEAVFLPTVDIKLDDGETFKAKNVVITNPTKKDTKDLFIVYWLSIDGKHVHNTFGVKIDQMLSGVLSQSRAGLLIRIDVRNYKYNPDKNEKALAIANRFINELYKNLTPETRALLTGKSK